MEGDYTQDSAILPRVSRDLTKITKQHPRRSGAKSVKTVIRDLASNDRRLVASAKMIIAASPHVTKKMLDLAKEGDRTCIKLALEPVFSKFRDGGEGRQIPVINITINGESVRVEQPIGETYEHGSGEESAD